MVPLVTISCTFGWLRQKSPPFGDVTFGAVQPLGDAFLVPAAVDEKLVAGGFLDRVEVVSEQVLDEGPEDSLVGGRSSPALRAGTLSSPAFRAAATRRCPAMRFHPPLLTVHRDTVTGVSTLRHRVTLPGRRGC